MSALLTALLALAVVPAQLPAPMGAAPVGTEAFHLIDERRQDLLAADRPRELVVQLWYPARATQGRALAHYLLELPLAEAMQKQRYLDLDADELGPWGDLDTHSSLGAPLAEGETRLPLLILSHGMGVARCNYTTIAEDLASHGFVVASIDHPYTGLMVLPDGRVVSNEQDARGAEAVVNRIEEMARDAGFVLDAILDPDGPLARFSGRIDAQRVGALGHSLGGAMALELGRGDPRFKACVDMDGAAFGRVESEGLERPCLVLLNEPERSKRPPPQMGKERHDSWVTILGKHRSHAFLATIENTDHFSFSDLPFLVTPESRARTGATLTPKRTREILSRLLCAFLFEELGLPESEGLEQAAAACPEIHLESLGG